MVSLSWFGSVAQSARKPQAQAAPQFGRISRGQYLRRGQSGPAIAQLQMLLKQAGFPVQIDGKFGSQTLQALKNFQRSHNCRVDGIVGPETLRAFQKSGQFDSPRLNEQRRNQNRTTGRTQSDARPQSGSSPSKDSVPVAQLIAKNNVRRAKSDPTQTTTPTPAQKLPASVAAQASKFNASVDNAQADKTARGNMMQSWRGIKNSRKWTGKCNAFAQRMMSAAGPKVKASAEAHRKSSLNAELTRVREQAQAKAGPNGLSRRQRRALRKQERRIRWKHTPKNMHNYLPPLKEGGRKAHAGLTMSQLAENTKTGKGPQLRPGMTIHVKAFPHEKSPYGSSKRNPSNQTHHWFTYVGKDKAGNPQFMDSWGKKKTPQQCDRWLQGWMRRSVRKGNSKKFGSYQAMRNRLASEGKAYQDRNGNWHAKRGVQATIEAVYSPYQD